MATTSLNENNLKEVIEGNDIVLVDFWAPWCGPCRAFGPVFEKTSERHPDLVFAKVDTEQEQGLAAAFNIRSIPTLMVFREQVLIFAQPGMVPADALEELIGKVKDLDMDEVREEVEKHRTISETAPSAASN